MPDPYLGEIRVFSAHFAPNGWAICDGSLLSISANSALHSLIGTTYGGDGTATFALPDLRGRAPMHVGSGKGLSPRTLGERGGAEDIRLQADQLPAHSHVALADGVDGNQSAPYLGLWAASSLLSSYANSAATSAMHASAIAANGNGAPHDNMPPYLAITFIISLDGLYPTPNGFPLEEAFLGQIQAFSFGFLPAGWALCNGQEYTIAGNEQLFGVLGTTYGGDGVTTFALPDLQGRMPMHSGADVKQGTNGGEESHTLTLNELPSHAHVPHGSMNFADSGDPSGGVWGNQAGAAAYSNRTPNIAMGGSAIGKTGSDQPHDNMSPYLVVLFGISLTGPLPSS